MRQQLRGPAAADRPPPNAIARWAACLAALLLTAVFRFVSLDNGFPNDHFIYISGGWQTLAGEWPTRDWIDPGAPLMFLASAAAQAMFGPILFAEAVLVSAAFGLAAALTLAAVTESTRSLGIGTAAAVVAVAVMPRTYSYPKALVYAAAFLCFYRYVNRPGTGRVIAMAFAVAVAFFFRHDHGLFLAVGAILTVLLSPGASGTGGGMRRASLFALATGAMLLPYFIYVQVHAGLWTYFQIGVEVSSREAARQWHEWPAVVGDELPLLSALVYELYAIPVFAVAVLYACRRHAQFRQFAAYVIPVAVVALAVNVSFIRTPIITRVPDAVVPAVVLGAWLVDRARHASRRRLIVAPACALAVIVFSASILQAGSVAEALDRIGSARRWLRPGELIAERSQQLRTPFFEQQLPSRAALSLVPFFSYVGRCTTPDDRLLIGGFLVEVPFFAQRRFAAGQGYFGGSFGSAIVDRLAFGRLQSQDVPLALIPGDELESFTAAFPLVARHLASRYQQLAAIPVGDEDAILVLVD